MPTPYYTSSSGSTPYSPTVAAAPYGGGGGQPMPPTEYGPPMGYPGSQPQDPYQSYSAPPPQNPYGAPANAQMPPYTYGNQPAYPAQGYTPGMQPGVYGAAPLPRRRSNVGVILAVIGAIVVLACVGSVVAVAMLARNGNSTTYGRSTTTSTTATPGTSNGVSPSGQPISPDAAAIISNALTTSSIDSNFAPTHLTSTFTPGQTVYVTFDIDSKGSPGCSIAKWYDNNQLVDTSPLKHSPENQVAYFSLRYNTATRGAVELYWTTDTNCTGGQLAQVVQFTVGTQTSTGATAPLAAIPSAAIVPEWQ